MGKHRKFGATPFLLQDTQDDYIEPIKTSVKHVDPDPQSLSSNEYFLFWKAKKNETTSFAKKISTDLLEQKEDETAKLDWEEMLAVSKITKEMAKDRARIEKELVEKRTIVSVFANCFAQKLITDTTSRLKTNRDETQARDTLLNQQLLERQALLAQAEKEKYIAENTKTKTAFSIGTLGRLKPEFADRKPAPKVKTNLFGQAVSTQTDEPKSSHAEKWGFTK